EICEVAADGDLKLEFYRLHAVVGDVEIFMHAPINPSADGETERARRNDAGFRRERTVGKENPRRVIGDGPAVQEFPCLSVGKDGPTADNARIEEVEPPFAWPMDLSVWITD